MDTSDYSLEYSIRKTGDGFDTYADQIHRNGVSMMNTIQLHDISKTFDQHPVFVSWNHNFETGMVHVLKGQSGCGKTTLLRMLMGLEIPDSGTITPLQNYR